MVAIEQVVASAVRMIERREAMRVVPARITPVAKAPALFRPAIEALGFRRRQIEHAVASADPHGWRDLDVRKRTGG